MSTGPAVAQRRIGVFGGSFDPPHSAHIALARLAIESLALDELHVIPTGQAWHKARALSAPEHRWAMAELAFGAISHVVVDDRELKRSGPTFTIDTLEALQAENPGAQLYLVMGADQFAAFPQWHRWKDILAIAIICIAERALPTGQTTNFDVYNGLENRFLKLEMPLMPVSATQIRQLAASGTIQNLESGELLPATVARYIALNKLYRPR